ncbi:MAG: enoyl-CoA hydratase/isomerase family protein [Alphaproteobacteria bacterium]|nr:enoyl-CoA hydratase/isomerase family protein [Alphaproteobacteria bacterium]
MSDAKELLIDHKGGVTTLTLNRPPLNLLTFSLLQGLARAFDDIETRDATRAVVIRGAGTRAFCAGADLKAEAEHDEGTSDRWREVGRGLIERIESFPKPVISAVQGWCIGGGTALAWPADIRVAAESAKFRAGDVYLGMSPNWGMGMVRLAHYLGRNRTLDIILFGDDVTAKQAYDFNLVSFVYPDATFDAEVARIADKMAGAAPLPVRAIKEGVLAQWRDSPDRAALVEERWRKIVAASEDFKEGPRAWREKRKPVFKGK